MAKAETTVDSPVLYRKPPPCDHATLLRLIHYDPQTGMFTWRVRPILRQQDKVWNARWAGKVAGSLWKGAKSGPYWKLVILSNVHYAQRIAWFYMTGEWPECTVDHRDGDGLNNRWGNLRAATHSQNSMNMKRRSDNAQGLKGVAYDKRRKHYFAHIAVGGKTRRIGTFPNAEDAHAAYCEEATKHYGKFARFK